MPVKFKDYYETLGVDRSADTDAIRKAYRKLARKYHPDVNKDAGAEDRFKEIGEAHEVLSDPEKRKRYDELGSNWRAGQEWNPPPGWQGGAHTFGGQGGGADFSDFFESLFGAGFGGFDSGPMGGRGGASFRARRGHDQEAEIEVSLEDAFHGVKRKIELTSQSVRPDGRLEPQRRSFEVNIPAGVSEGSRIRLAGQGSPGSGGGPGGDLFLRVRLKPHPRFEVDDHNLKTTVPLAPWEAALGAEVSVPTIDGSVQMKIPAGTDSGKTLRLRGKGLPKTSGGAGDLLVTTKIVVPKHLTEEERRLFEELSKSSEFRPRK